MTCETHRMRMEPIDSREEMRWGAEADCVPRSIGSVLSEVSGNEVKVPEVFVRYWKEQLAIRRELSRQGVDATTLRLADENLTRQMIDLIRQSDTLAGKVLREQVVGVSYEKLMGEKLALVQSHISSGNPVLCGVKWHMFHVGQRVVIDGAEGWMSQSDSTESVTMAVTREDIENLTPRLAQFNFVVFETGGWG